MYHSPGEYGPQSPGPAEVVCVPTLSAPRQQRGAKAYGSFGIPTLWSPIPRIAVPLCCCLRRGKVLRVVLDSESGVRHTPIQLYTRRGGSFHFRDASLDHPFFCPGRPWSRRVRPRSRGTAENGGRRLRARMTSPASTIGLDEKLSARTREKNRASPSLSHAEGTTLPSADGPRRLPMHPLPHPSGTHREREAGHAPYVTPPLGPAAAVAGIDGVRGSCVVPSSVRGARSGLGNCTSFRNRAARSRL